MKKATKPHEIIYINSFITQTQEGDALMFMAIDEYAEFMFPPASCLSIKTNDEEFIGTLIQFFNGINDTYNREIHAQSTTYIVNFPPDTHQLIKGLIMNEDSLMYAPDKVDEVFKHVFDEFHKMNS